MPLPRLDCSVVVCTHMRPQRMRATLLAYAEIVTGAGWELIVVDSSTDDLTQDVLLAASGMPLVSVRLPRAGLSEARNAGIDRARGRIVCFSDDDCLPAPDFVDSWVSAFAPGSLDFAAGRIELFDPADIEVTIKTDTAPMDFAPRQLIGPGAVHGANLAFRREVLVAIGGFDTDFGPGTPLIGADDTVCVQTAALMGFRGGYRPGPMVRHHHGRGEADRAALMVLYVFSGGAFFGWLLFTAPGVLIAEMQRHRRLAPSFLAFAKLGYWAFRRRCLRDHVLFLRGVWTFMTLWPRRLFAPTSRLKGTTA